MHLKVGLMFNPGSLRKMLGKIKQYNSLVGKEYTEEIILENDIGEPGEIYDGAVCSLHRRVDITLTRSGKFRTAYIPSMVRLNIDSRSPIQIAEVYIQPNRSVHASSISTLGISRINKLHVEDKGSLKVQEFLDSDTIIDELIIHGESGIFDLQDYSGIKTIVYDKECRYLVDYCHIPGIKDDWRMFNKWAAVGELRKGFKGQDAKITIRGFYMNGDRILAIGELPNGKRKDIDVPTIDLSSIDIDSFYREMSLAGRVSDSREIFEGFGVIVENGNIIRVNELSHEDKSK